jgi:hypothetical protein
MPIGRVEVSLSEYSPDELSRFLDELKKSNYTPLVGTFGLSGPYFEGFGSPDNSNNQTVVYYFDLKSKEMAVEVATMVSKTLSIKTVEPRFVDPATIPRKDQSFMIENSGLDLQVYLEPPRRLIFRKSRLGDLSIAARILSPVGVNPTFVSPTKTVPEPPAREAQNQHLETGWLPPLPAATKLPALST